MKTRNRFIAALLTAILIPAPAALAQDMSSGSPLASQLAPARARPTIAIAPFDTDRTGWVPPPNFGDTVSDLLATRLVDLGAYRVFDRSLLPESDPRGRRPSFDAIRELASQAGVDYVILGAVTRFGSEKSNNRAGILGIPFVGGGGRHSQESSVGLTLRVVSVRTGEVVSSSVSTGTASKKSRTVAGGALVHGIPVGGIYSSGSTGALDRLVAEALVKAVEDAATSLTKAAARITGIS